MESVKFTIPMKSYNNIISSLKKFVSKSLAQAIGVLEVF